MSESTRNRDELQKVTLRISESAVRTMEIAGLRKPRHIEPAVFAYAKAIEPIATLSAHNYLDALLSDSDIMDSGKLLEMMPTIYPYNGREYQVVQRDPNPADSKISIRLPRLTVMTFGYISLALGQGSAISTLIEPAVEGFGLGSHDVAMARVDELRHTLHTEN